ncbi:hypothetical protein GCM10009117_14740 [Gangjinia marincola]|uniref:Glycosyl hydrolase family 13 catalytic domain-containing protein n=1 Tax=Gangjinia marincola TaxID=578463 RepID=A0ABN1MHI0_9FLAO
MKKIIFLFSILFTSTSIAQGVLTIDPPTFNEDQEITITFSGIDVPADWGVNDVYLWAWYFDLDDNFVGNSPVTGNDFGNSPPAAQFTDNGDGTYSYTLTPTAFYNDTGIGRIGLIAKSQNGSNQTNDFLFEVGVFQLNLISPVEDITLVQNGTLYNIAANVQGATADFELLADGSPINAVSNVSNYSFDFTVTQTTDFVLSATSTDTGETLTEEFTLLVIDQPQILPVPAGANDGANIDFPNDDDLTLVLYGKDKDFVHLISELSNWEIDNNYLLNFDPALDKHWITISNVTQDNFLYQYLVDAQIRVADPYSTLILDEFNDPFISNATFPNIPDYPDDLTDNPVSWVRTNQTDYNWQNDNVNLPAKEDLIIYEVLLRDFDDNHNFDDVVNRLDYLENLGVNAIELMPVNEFDGNLSWGYNPAFHNALDKYYGTPEDFKNLVDECHARGIAVIVDVVYNQGTGQHPFYRMYNTDNGGTGGQATADSPFFNPSATHAYNVFNDFDHSSAATQEYVEQTLQYWLNEFHLDGFRFDLTKGFTQNCTGGDEGCTNGYQADRVAVLKEYADAVWEANDDAYVIFEHLGSGGSRQEEIEWSNYRLNEGKGIMFWDKHTFAYNEATMGYSNANFNGISWQNIGLDAPRNVGYMESHDEERLMYKNLAFGNSSGGYDVTELPIALERMKAAGAFFLTVPGPKMIWQFGELGYDTSIFTCPDGTIPQPYGNDSCKLADKPDGWDFLNEADRVEVYDLWSTLIGFKQSLPIFKTDNFTIESQTTDGLKRIYLTDDDATGNEIRHVVILGNFSVTTKDITPDFPETGEWFNMLTNASVNVVNTSTPITLAPGEFLMYSSEDRQLSVQDVTLQTISMYPNPSNGGISFSNDIDGLHIYDVSGKQVFAQGGKIVARTTIEHQLSSGIYFVQLQKGALQQTLKLIVK